MTGDGRALYRMTNKLTIIIPGMEKAHTTFHPNETAARAHLKARLDGIPGVPVGFPPLPPGTEWRIVAMVEEEIAKGKVPPK
jgi:hypothetical protein